MRICSSLFDHYLNSMKINVQVIANHHFIEDQDVHFDCLNHWKFQELQILFLYLEVFHLSWPVQLSEEGIEGASLMAILKGIIQHEAEAYKMSEEDFGDESNSELEID